MLLSYCPLVTYIRTCDFTYCILFIDFYSEEPPNSIKETKTKNGKVKYGL